MPRYRVVFKLINKTKDGVGGIMIDEEGSLSLSHGVVVISDKAGLKRAYAPGYWEYVERLEKD